MKINLFKAGVLLAATALFSWNPALAQRRGPASLIDYNAQPATERPVATKLQATDYGSDAEPSPTDTSGNAEVCNACNDYNSCAPCRRRRAAAGMCADCDEDRNLPINIAGFASMDSWRGPADGSYQSNFGSVTGLNVGAPLLASLGIGGQLGASYGVFDWAGRESNGTERQNQPQQQIFVTTGIFRRANECQLFNWGIGFDWMFNRNYGLLAQSPTMGQWRAMAGINLNTWNELGVWGAVSQIEDSKLFDGAANVRLTTAIIGYRPRSQANLFWHHKYAFGGDTWLWVGATERPRLGTRGTETPIIIGGSMNIPLTASLSAYGSFTYVTSSFASANAIGAQSDITNVSLGLAWYPGAKARSRTVSGRCWAPYLPMANNGNFFVDTNAKF